jgi:hypothetical protein
LRAWLIHARAGSRRAKQVSAVPSEHNLSRNWRDAMKATSIDAAQVSSKPLKPTPTKAADVLLGLLLGAVGLAIAFTVFLACRYALATTSNPGVIVQIATFLLPISIASAFVTWSGKVMNRSKGK